MNSSPPRSKERSKHQSTTRLLFVTVALALCCTGFQLYVSVFSSSGQLKFADFANQPHRRDHFSLTTAAKVATVHVLYGLHGNNTGFLDQWEVSLKSVLLNAPLDHPLHVHIIANGQAQDAVSKRLEESLLTPTTGTLSRNPIDFTIYNVDECHDTWTQFLQLHFRDKASDVNQTGRFTLGVYYRLLAYQVILPYWDQQRQQPAGSVIQQLPKTLYKRNPSKHNVTVNAILYMDADAVVLSNLNDLWRNVIHENDGSRSNNNEDAQEQEEPPIYQWSATKKQNSGFVIFYLKQMHRFWQLLDKLTDKQFFHTNDQAMLQAVARVFPAVQGRPLPEQWDVHMGHGWRQRPYLIYTNQEKVGMAHFSGKAPVGKSFLDDVGVIKYCHRSPKCKENATKTEDYMKTWGLVDYYIRIPWHYVRYFLESQIPITTPTVGNDNTTTLGGYPISLNVVQWSLPPLTN